MTVQANDKTMDVNESSSVLYKHFMEYEIDRTVLSAEDPELLKPLSF